MMRFLWAMICLLLVTGLLGGVSGCASLFKSKPKLDYCTVPADPNHDTEEACEQNQRALKLLKKGKPVKAEQALQKSLVADVTYGPAHNNLGKLYYHQKKFYLAAWEFESATKLMPECPEPQNNLGLVFEAVGKYDEAVNCYRTALHLQPNNPQFIGNLARVRVRQGDLDTETRQLLEGLVAMDTRPQWVAWAKYQLALKEELREKEAVPNKGLPEVISTPQPTETTEAGLDGQDFSPSKVLQPIRDDLILEPETILSP